jgi:hypothetical protein
MASMALLASGQAGPTHDISLQVRDEQARLAASFTGTLRYDGPRTYSARVCLKDELKDGRGPYFHFEYLYADGRWHVTRTWRSSEGAGTTVCHQASVDWPPDIDGIWIRASVDQLGTQASAFYDNPFASQPPRPVDADGDGFATGQDCNDGDPAIHPGAVERRGNAIDENCDGRAEDLLPITSGVTSEWLVRGAAARGAHHGSGSDRQARPLPAPSPPRADRPRAVPAAGQARAGPLPVTPPRYQRRTRTRVVGLVVAPPGGVIATRSVAP